MSVLDLDKIAESFKPRPAPSRWEPPAGADPEPEPYGYVQLDAGDPLS
jgi:hypothetical protein